MHGAYANYRKSLLANGGEALRAEARGGPAGSVTVRFERRQRGQHGQNEADQRYHCANLADSIT